MWNYNKHVDLKPSWKDFVISLKDKFKSTLNLCKSDWNSCLIYCAIDSTQC